MAKKFKKLIDKLPDERQKAIRARIDAELEQLPLQELRHAQKLTQVQVAAALKMNQAAVSKMEHQTDMYVSTLRRFVAAMGGELKIIAQFPEGDILINQFEEI